VRISTSIKRTWNVGAISAQFLLWILIATTMGLTACYPGPEKYYRTQEFVGNLMGGSAPMRDVIVEVSNASEPNKGHCDQVMASTKTDSSGYFRIPPLVESRIFTFLNSPSTIWQVRAICFHIGARKILGAVIFSHVDRPLSYNLSCDVEAAPRAFSQQFVTPPDEYGICTNAK
jgi:hypothetical protein